MGAIKQGKRHAFWWTPEFVSVESLRSKTTLKQGKFLKFLKVTAKPKVLENLKRSWKKSWNLKSSKECEPCWCLKRIKRRPRWCLKAILWEWTLFLLSKWIYTATGYVSENAQRCVDFNFFLFQVCLQGIKNSRPLIGLVFTSDGVRVGS